MAGRTDGMRVFLRHHTPNDGVMRAVPMDFWLQADGPPSVSFVVDVELRNVVGGPWRFTGLSRLGAAASLVNIAITDAHLDAISVDYVRTNRILVENVSVAKTIRLDAVTIASGGRVATVASSFVSGSWVLLPESASVIVVDRIRVYEFLGLECRYPAPTSSFLLVDSAFGDVPLSKYQNRLDVLFLLPPMSITTDGGKFSFRPHSPLSVGSAAAARRT